jgi:hypothetical protein
LGIAALNAMIMKYLFLFPRSHLPNKPNLLILNRFREIANSIEKTGDVMMILKY